MRQMNEAAAGGVEAGEGAGEAGGGPAGEAVDPVMHQNAPLCTTSGGGGIALREPPGPEIEDREAALPPEQLQAIGLILIGRSMSSVARAVGVDRSTLFRWRQQPAFSAVLRFRQEAIFNQATDRLRASLVRAMREIHAELCSRQQHVRLAAAYRLLPYVGSPKLRPPTLPMVDDEDRDDIEPADPLKPRTAAVR